LTGKATLPQTHDQHSKSSRRAVNTQAFLLRRGEREGSGDEWLPFFFLFRASQIALIFVGLVYCLWLLKQPMEMRTSAM